MSGADHVVPAAGLAPLLVNLVRQPVRDRGNVPMTDPLDRMLQAVTQAKLEPGTDTEMAPGNPGRPASGQDVTMKEIRDARKPS
jgi:hypothetical protein